MPSIQWLQDEISDRDLRYSGEVWRKYLYDFEVYPRDQYEIQR